MSNDKNLNITEVEKLANELCAEYGNAKYFKWYCGVIYEFGFEQIINLRARVSDAPYKGRLFSKIVNEWRQKKKLDEFMANHGPKKD